ncbi:MAG: sigma-70 family RNA polymerase sigma factor [Planctomycetota bacterium]
MILTMTSLAAIDLSAARGDAEAEEFLAAMRGIQPALVTLIWRLLAWPAQAAEIEDVLQEVWLTAWSRRGQLRSVATREGWLRRIAINTARNHARATRRRALRVGLAGFGPCEEPVAAPQDAVDDRVRGALARLRHADREVLVLHYLEGTAIEDCARLLGLRRNAVDARLSRARKRLQAEIGDGDE